MKLIKEFAWYGSAVTFAALIAVALLFASPAHKVEAVAFTATSITGNITSTQLANTLNNEMTFAFTIATTIPADGGATNNVVDVAFPADSVATNTLTGDWVLTDVGTGAVTQTAFDSTGVNVRIEVAGELTAGAFTLVLAAGKMNLPHTDSAASVVTISTGDSCTSGNAGANMGGCNTGAYIDAGTFATGATVSGLRVDQASVLADGLSTAILRFNSGSNNSVYGTGDVLTISTTAGKFITPTNLASVNATPSLTADAMTMTASLATVGATAMGTLVTLQSSTTVETATIKQYVTPAAGGTAVLIDTNTVLFTVAPGATALAAITPVAAVTAGKSATTSAITVTVTDALGNTPIVAESYTITSTNGTFGSLTGAFSAGTGTGTQSVAGTLSAGSGTFTLTGLGIAGASTVTFTRGTVTATKTVTFSGTTSTVTGSTTSSISPAAWTYIGSGTISNDAPKVRFTLKDADGNVVGGVTPTLTQDPVGAVTFGAVGASSSTYGRSDTTITAENVATATEVTVTATVGSGASAKTGTVTFTVGGTSASTVEVTAADVDPVTVSTIDVVVKDSSGNIMQDGTPITAVVTAGSLVATTADTSGGLATFTYVSPGTAQSVNFTAITGTKTGSATFNVGTVAEVVVVEPVATVAALTAPPAGGLTQGIAGTDDLTALVDAQTFDVESVWKLDVATQTFQSYFPGAAAFANTLTAIAATDIVTIRSQ